VTRPHLPADALPEITAHRVGPDGTMPSDSQFARALTSLWHTVSLAGGAVGCTSTAARPEVAAKAAGVVAELRDGRSQAVALIADRQLVGFGRVTAGTGLAAHTGEITAVMVDPALQGGRLGTRVMTEILALATELGLERVTVSVRDGHRLADFFARFGFAEWGRRPGWIRQADEDDLDEVFLWAALPGRVAGDR
jgi:GNAT superfamily N-acetyltransferase